MKTIQYIKALSVVALLGIVSQANAQEETTNYLNREMTLEREYDPSVQDANKVNTLPVIKEPEVRKIPIDYATFTLPANPAKEFSLLPSGSIMTDMNYNKRRGYLNLAGGTYMNLNGDLGYQILSTDKDQLNIFVSHRSSNGKIKYNQGRTEDKVKAKLNDNLGGLQYRHVFDRAIMNLGGSYNYTGFNYYGLPLVTSLVSPPLEYDWDTNQVNQAIKVNAGVASIPGSSTVGYRVAVDYTNFSQKYAYSKNLDGLTEHTIHGLIDINAAIATSQLVGVTADVNYYSISSPLEDAYENKAVGTLSPYYRVEGSNWNLQLGANMFFTTGNFKKVNFSPNIAANVVVADKTSLYLRAGGAIRSNSFYELAQVNRYDNPYSSGPTSKNWLNAVGGVKSAVAESFWFDIFAGYQITDDYIFFIPSTSEDSGIVPSTSDFGQAYGLCALDAKRLFFGASLKYAYQKFFELRLKGTYSNWDVEEEGSTFEHKAYGTPNLEINGGLTVRPIDKLALDIDYILAAGRYASPALIEEKMKNINELNATVTYALNNTFGVYAKLNNMLFQKYELYYGYPMQKFNAMIGINLNF